MERVAVAVERCERHAGGREQVEVLVPRVLAGAHLRGREMGGRQEAARVDLCAVEAEIADDLEGLRYGLVVKTCGVSTEFHASSFLWVESRPGLGEPTSEPVGQNGRCLVAVQAAEGSRPARWRLRNRPRPE